jgi:internalin A
METARVPSRSRCASKFVMSRLMTQIVAILLLVACCVTHAQPGGYTSISLDSLVLSSDTVVVGKLTGFKLDEHGYVSEGVISVDETLRGQPRDALKTPLAIHEEVAAKFVATGEPLIIFVPHPTEGWATYVEVRALAHPNQPIITKDGVFLATKDEVIRNARRIAGDHTGQFVMGTFPVGLPRGVLDAFPEANGLSFYRLEVPVDEALEREAQAFIRERPKKSRLDLNAAIGILGSFKSPENIKLVESLLGDKSVSVRTDPGSNNGHGMRAYYVRESAYEQLSTWGVKVPKPVITETFYDPGAVAYAALGPTVTDKDITSLRTFKSLRYLNLEDSNVTDGQLKLVAQFGSLKDLNLTATHITDAGLAALAGMKGLEILNLERTRITGIGLNHLAMLKLRHLGLSGTSVGDDGMLAIAKITTLTGLDLDRTKVTFAGLSALAPLRRLAELELSDQYAFGARTDASPDVGKNLHALRQIGLLHALSFCSGKGKDDRAATDAEITGISLMFTPAGDNAIAELADLPNLEDLSISGTKVTDRGIAMLPRLKKLRFLNADAIAITDIAMASIGRLTLLEHLNLSDTGIGDAGLRELGDLHSLQGLYLDGTKITDRGAAEIAHIPSLLYLGIGNSRITDAAMAALAPLTRLKRLDLLKAKQITDAGLASLARLPALEQLDCAETKVTPEGVVALLKSRPSLKVDRGH